MLFKRCISAAVCYTGRLHTTAQCRYVFASMRYLMERRLKRARGHGSQIRPINLILIRPGPPDSAGDQWWRRCENSAPCVTDRRRTLCGERLPVAAANLGPDARLLAPGPRRAGSISSQTPVTNLRLCYQITASRAASAQKKEYCRGECSVVEPGVRACRGP